MGKSESGMEWGLGLGMVGQRKLQAWPNNDSHRQCWVGCSLEWGGQISALVKHVDGHLKGDDDVDDDDDDDEAEKRNREYTKENATSQIAFKEIRFPCHFLTVW